MSFFTMPEKHFPGRDILLRKKCSVTGEIYEVAVPHTDYVDWEHGKLAPKAFPQLTTDQREFIMTGSTPAEWAKMFSGGEEE